MWEFNQEGWHRMWSDEERMKPEVLVDVYKYMRLDHDHKHIA